MTKANRIALIIAAILVVAVVAGMTLFRDPLRALFTGDVDTNSLLVSGNIEAHESVLSFKTVQSRIVELPFNEGQWVSKGAVLAVVDATDYRQQQAIAEAALAVQQRQLASARQNLATAGKTLLVDQAELRQRQLDLQRARDLQKKEFISTASVDKAETAVKEQAALQERDQSVQAEASSTISIAQAGIHGGEESATLARINVGYTTLTAPFDGVITVRQAELGEVVVPGTPVVTLADLDHIWLRAYVNETDIGRVRLGQSVTVTTDSHPDKRYAGRISFIADKAEFTPKSVETHAERVSLVYRIKVDIANPNHELVPGMPADARIDLRAKAS